MAAIELTNTTNTTKTGILTALNAQTHLTWVATNSADLISVESSVFNTSGSWNNGFSRSMSVFQTVSSLSGSWNSTNTSVFNTSGSWNSTNTSVFNTSGSWNSVYSHVNTTSGSKFSGTFYTLSSDNVTVAALQFTNGLLVSITP